MKTVLLCALVLGVSVAMLSGCATVSSTADAKKYEERAASGDEAAIKALIDALGSGDKAVRDAAYASLTQAGPPAVPQLIETLKSEDPQMQEYAAGALGNIGDGRAVEPLIGMLDDPRARRYVAVWALGELKAEAAVGKLVAALGEENEALQKEATRGLIKIGKPAVPALIDALENTDPDVRKFSARALGVIQDRRAEAPLVRHLSDADPEVAAASALALGTAGGGDAIPSLVDSLKANYMNTRVNAAISLGQLEAAEAVEPLTAIMENDDDPYVREWSARALENITGNRYKYRDEKGVMVYPYNLYR